MIFITVGTQLPFDRMVRTVDEWAAEANRRDVFAQIGGSVWTPRNIAWTRFISPAECHARIQMASVVISHAGMGTIIAALQLGKPILVMPRRAALGEQRNDHQLATARHLAAHKRILVAMDESELAERLGQLDTMPAPASISPYASPQLLDAIRSFIGTSADEPVRPRVVTRPIRHLPSKRREHA